MSKKKFKLYQTKNIYLAYVTTVNPDSYTIEGQLIKSVLALESKKHGKKQTSMIPVNPYFPYYSINEVVPISKVLKQAGKLITLEQIEKTVEQAKRMQTQTKKQTPNSIQLEDREDNKVNKIVEELDIQKSKKLIV